MKQTIQANNSEKRHTEIPPPLTARALQEISVALLTGGGDRPYVYGLTKALTSIGIRVDLIGSDELDEPDLRNERGVNFLNLRGDQRHDAGVYAKVHRLSAYYWRLIRYAAAAKPKVFHILWNNKLEFFDRTLLMMYYKILGKAVVLTAHNVNKGRRDSTDSMFNRLSLRVQYGLTDRIFVHTKKMKSELMKEFDVPVDRVTIIPFGINNSVADTNLSPNEAKELLGIRGNNQTILFFGRIRPYKGLDYLVTAFQRLAQQDHSYRLIIAGRIEQGCEQYWESIKKVIQGYVDTGQVILRIEFIPDSETEVYFKAADILALPYREIFQSGVLVLGYSFGLPVVAADVGSLKDDIIEGKTGFVFRPEDPVDLARAISLYFASDLFRNLDTERRHIKDHALQQHSWEIVGQKTADVYSKLLQMSPKPELSNADSSEVPTHMNTPQ
jgi:glycosyltransferase involved in cell wall biosynthesis